MTSIKKTARRARPGWLVLAATVLAGAWATPATAATDPAIASCLATFGDHPFGADPAFRTLPVAVKVFGIGKATVDDTATEAPELVYVKTGVNVMGGTTITLGNPNGWYCMRSSVNVMGGLTIRLACDARFAMAGDGATVLGNSAEDTGTTVMGGTRIERDC